MTIAQKLSRAKADYDAVKEAGIAQGKKEQYHAFWDNFQQNGNRRDYNYGFVGYGFNADNFYPKYNIVLEGNNTYTFGYWRYGIAGKTTLNLRERLVQCGKVLDTSKATGLTAMFSYSDFTEIPTIDCSSLTTATTNLFNGNGNTLTKIEKIKTHKDVTYVNWFRYDTLLVDVTFEGVIGQNIDFGSCPNLSRASIENIVEHLSDTSTGKTLTLLKSAVNKAFTTAEFEALKATRTNWTFSLV